MGQGSKCYFRKPAKAHIGVNEGLCNFGNVNVLRDYLWSEGIRTKQQSEGEYTTMGVSVEIAAFMRPIWLPGVWQQ